MKLSASTCLGWEQKKDEEGAGERSERGGRVDEGERPKTSLDWRKKSRKDEEVLVKEAKGTC